MGVYMRTIYPIICLLFLISGAVGCSAGSNEEPLSNTVQTIDKGKNDTENESLLISSQAGFYEIEPIDFSFQQKGSPVLKLTSSRARILYSFFPADDDPESKPLFVIFSGGPGCATCTNIFSMNTAPHTLVSERTGGAPCSENPFSWTQMGNLLYIDAPNTGFSYNLADNASNIFTRMGEFGAQNYNPFIDAAQYIRVILRFMNDHPAIEKNRVVIAGESYGGTRASSMLNMLLFYSSYGDGSRIYKNPALADEIGRHLEKTITGSSEKPFSPDMIAKQFGSQILIEPQLTGRYQTMVTGEMFEKKDSVMFRLAEETGTKYSPCSEKTGLARLVCDPYNNAFVYTYLIAKRDVYEMTKPYDFSDIVDKFAADGFMQMDVLSTVLEYDAGSIELLKPAARDDAYRYVHAGEISGGVDFPSEETFNSLPSKAKAWLRYRKTHLNKTAEISDFSLEKVLGGLKYWDEYFVSCNMMIYFAFYYNQVTMISGYDVDPESPIYGEMFLENLAFVKSMITDAARDMIVFPQSIPPSFKMYSDIVENVETTDGTVAGDRFLRVTYKPGSLGKIPTPDLRTIYFPYYNDSGHSVSLAEPEKLLSDIKRWMDDFE